MPLDQNPHQTVTRFRCVGFSMYACGFSEPQMRQYFLFTYPPRSKWTSSEKIIFFARSGIFYKSISGPLLSIVQAYTQPYSFGGRTKLIICQITHKLSVTIHEISTSWKKKTLDGEPYIWFLGAFAFYDEIKQLFSNESEVLLIWDAIIEIKWCRVFCRTFAKRRVNSDFI